MAQKFSPLKKEDANTQNLVNVYYVSTSLTLHNVKIHVTVLCPSTFDPKENTTRKKIVFYIFSTRQNE